MPLPTELRFPRMFFALSMCIKCFLSHHIGTLFCRNHFVLVLGIRYPPRNTCKSPWNSWFTGSPNQSRYHWNSSSRPILYLYPTDPTGNTVHHRMWIWQDARCLALRRCRVSASIGMLPKNVWRFSKANHPPIHQEDIAASLTYQLQEKTVFSWFENDPITFRLASPVPSNQKRRLIVIGSLCKVLDLFKCNSSIKRKPQTNSNSKSSEAGSIRGFATTVACLQVLNLQFREILEAHYQDCQHQQPLETAWSCSRSLQIWSNPQPTACGCSRTVISVCM